MNRRERRAKGIKNSDPVFTIKKSEMQEHFNKMMKNDPNVRRAIEEEARKANLREYERQAVDIDALILYSLHKSEGYGRIRLLRFAHTLNELRKYYEGLYEDCDMFAMKKHLKEFVGIDVEHLDEEIARYEKEIADKR